MSIRGPESFQGGHEGPKLRNPPSAEKSLSTVFGSTNYSRLKNSASSHSTYRFSSRWIRILWIKLACNEGIERGENEMVRQRIKWVCERRIWYANSLRPCHDQSCAPVHEGATNLAESLLAVIYPRQAASNRPISCLSDENIGVRKSTSRNPVVEFTEYCPNFLLRLRYAISSQRRVAVNYVAFRVLTGNGDHDFFWISHL